MSPNPLPRKPRRPKPAEFTAADDGPLLDLDRYVPAFVTFIANKLSNSATVFYQRNFGVNVTEWRVMSLLAVEPRLPAPPVCPVLRFHKGPGRRTLAAVPKRGPVAVPAAPGRGRHHRR